MKQIIFILTSCFSIKSIAKLFVVFNLGISYVDSTCFFYRLYDMSVQTVGLSIFLLTYLFIIYWKKVTEIPIDPKVNKYFIPLKVMLLILLTAPIFVDNNWQVMNFNHMENLHIIRSGVEIMKVICIEFVIEILFNIIKSFNIHS